MHAPGRKKLTPVMRQYDDAKAAHPDAILFFRLGDFYEMFNEDAVVCSRALNLTLTSRNKGDPDEVPMAGVPYHAAHGYVAKLLALGHKVALCEQMADPSKTKGIVPREVVRVLTPSLVTDGDQLDAKANLFRAAVDALDGRLAIALLDLSTGELVAGELADAATLLAELARAEPREVLLPRELGELRATISVAVPAAFTRDDEELASDAIAHAIDEATGLPLAEEALREHPIVVVRAAARALRFARKCTPAATVPVRRIAPFDASHALRIDETAQAHLELVRSTEGSLKGSLLHVLDATVTPPGARLLRRRLLSPLIELGAIRRRQDDVETFVVNPRARDELRDALGGVGDLERLAIRALLREATPRDLGALRDGLLAAPRAVEAIRKIPDPGARDALGVDVDLAPEIAAELERGLVDRPPPHARDGGVVREGFDATLDELRGLKKNGTELLVAMEAELKQSTGVPLRVRYNSVFGWYIEVTRANVAKVPPAWRRKQTVAGGERYTTPDLDDLADKVEHAEARSIEIEIELFERLRTRVATAADRIKKLARAIADWDVSAALADVAQRYDYARPEVDDGDALVIEEGRHPVVERLAAAGRFVPNDTTLDLAGERLWLVTGPNMAGKSTLMRQVALIVILAQMGSYVPARSARIGLCDRVLSRVGASDNVARGESTFMVEMRETAAILREATRRSLVILDEIGRGTSTYDGLAIAWAVAEHLHDAIGCRALFATHYHELTELAKAAPGVANYSVAAREHGDDVVFLHKLAKGPASRSYGVAVARLAGLPESVLARSRAILGTLEAGAALPSGRHASLRGKNRAGLAQLDLFGGGAAPDEPSPIVETLRHLDIDRLTPLDALTLVAKLKGMVKSSPA